MFEKLTKFTVQLLKALLADTFALILFLVLLVVLFLVSGCAGWQPTTKAIERRYQGEVLRSCVNGDCSQDHVRACLRESVERCKAAKMESSCGADAIWTSDPVMCRR